MSWPAGHEHVCLTIGDRAALLRALRGFVATLEERDGIFVHRYDPREAQALLREAGLTDLLAARLTIVDRDAAFQGGKPAIDHGHVAHVVEAAAQRAQQAGRGLSILADASHAYIDEGRAAEWFAFETWLGRRLERDVVLVCLYWEGDLGPTTVDPMVQTHSARWSAVSMVAAVA